MATWVFLNDELVEEEKAALHYRDLSFLRGYGIFDFFRLVGNEPLFLEDHLDRFFYSAEGMHLHLELSREELKTAIYELIKKNDLPDTGIRLGLSGGYSEDGFNLGKPNLVLSQHSFTPPNQTEIEQGIKLTSYPHIRQLPHIKSIDYLTAIWLQPVRVEKGADDILYHHGGIVSECPRSNFFLITQDDKIITPSGGALKGITRKKLIELVSSDFTIEERAITLDDVKFAKEAFITSTTKRLLPIRKIDEVVYDSTEIGRTLLASFRSAYSC